MAMFLTMIYGTIIQPVVNCGFFSQVNKSAGQVATGGANASALENFFGNPLVNLIITIITSFFTAIITTKITNKIDKKADAKYGYHPRLNKELKALSKILAKECSENKNPYCLLYKIDVFNAPFGMAEKPEMPCNNYDGCIKRFSSISKTIKELLEQNDNNVSPSKISQEEWNKNQEIVHAFIRMIIDNEGVRSIDLNNHTHIDRYKQLLVAIEKLINATEYSVN